MITENISKKTKPAHKKWQQKTFLSIYLMFILLCCLPVLFMLGKYCFDYFTFDAKPYEWDLSSRSPSGIPEWTFGDPAAGISGPSLFVGGRKQFLLNVKLSYGCELRGLRLKTATMLTGERSSGTYELMQDVFLQNHFLTIEEAITLAKDWAEQLGIQDKLQIDDIDSIKTSPPERLEVVAGTMGVFIDGAIYDVNITRSLTPTTPDDFTVEIKIYWYKEEPSNSIGDYTAQAYQNCKYKTK